MTMTTDQPAVEEPERVTPEVVEAPAASTEVATRDPRNDAIEQAADAALAMPGVPGRDEFLSLAMQARILSMSGAAPKAIRDNPYVAFHVAMVGRDLGISPSAAITLIDVIGEGDKVQVSLSPQLLNGQLRRLKLGQIVPAAQSLSSCTAVCLSWSGRLDPACARTYPQHVEGCACAGIIGDSTFTWEDAQIAGLVDSRCPDAADHWKPTNGNGRCDCRQGWRTYPKRMLWWRSSGYAADDYFPEAGLGLYAPEELGAVVDDEGRPIDPTSVALPDGYEPPPPKVNPATQPGDPDELWTLQERVHALPTQERADLAERWKSTAKLKGSAVRTLLHGDVKLAASLIAGFERTAKKGGEWDPDAALTETREREAQQLAVTFGLYRTGIIDGLPADPEFDVDNPEPTATDSGPAEPEAGAQPSDGDAGRKGEDNAADGHTAGDADPVEAAIASVLAMSKDEVTAALRAGQLSVTGNDDTRRRRLTEHLVRQAQPE